MTPDVAIKAMILVGAFAMLAGWLFLPHDDIYDVDLHEDEDVDS